MFQLVPPKCAIVPRWMYYTTRFRCPVMLSHSLGTVKSTKNKFVIPIMVTERIMIPNRNLKYTVPLTYQRWAACQRLTAILRGEKTVVWGAILLKTKRSIVGGTKTAIAHAHVLPVRSNAERQYPVIIMLPAKRRNEVINHSIKDGRQIPADVRPMYPKKTPKLSKLISTILTEFG